MTDKIVVGGPPQQTKVNNFKPPQEVAAEDQSASNTAGAGSGTPGGPSSLPMSTPPNGKRSFMSRLKALSTTQKVLLTVAAVVVVSGSAIGSYFLFFQKQPIAVAPIQNQQPKEEPKPTTVASNLSGLQVDPSFNERPVTSVMIENSMDARPQSGLNQASVVFEAIAEGGITRFNALFQDTEPEYVGPVRSVRPYYLSWLLGFDAPVAHAGGSAEALSLIKQWNVKDLNHHNSYFWRVSNRAAPHNLYTSIAKLREYEASKGFGKSNFSPLPRKDKEAPAPTPTARSIDMNVSSANFAVHYDYDATTNTYKRSVGGAIHTDEKSGAQLAPKVVIALVVPQGKSGIYTTYQTTGSGQVIVFQDGTATAGTWKKDSNSANFTFTDTNGTALKLNPGQTWFTVVGSTGLVTYAP